VPETSLDHRHHEPKQQWADDRAAEELLARRGR